MFHINSSRFRPFLVIFIILHSAYCADIPIKEKCFVSSRVGKPEFNEYYEDLTKVINPCKLDEDCLEFATCYNNDCVCNRNYVFHDKKCHQLKQMGEPCEFDIECQGSMSILAKCEESRCTCGTDSYYAYGNGNLCLAKSRINEYCRYQSDCEHPPPIDLRILHPGVEMNCISNTCRCSIMGRSVYNGTRCLSFANYLERCQDNAHCGSDELICRNVCVCKNRKICSFMNTRPGMKIWQ